MSAIDSGVAFATPTMTSTERESAERAGHTPGPWSFEPHGNTVALYSGRSNGLNGRHGLRLMKLDDGDSNFEANARLIVAAPDLLAMLRVAQLWLDVDGRFDMQGVNAAIAKAEGRS